jgi:hypothetical protein
LFDLGINEEVKINVTCLNVVPQTSYATFNVTSSDYDFIDQLNVTCLILDNIPPSLVLFQPQNKSYIYYPDVLFNFTVTDNYFENLTCNLTVNNSKIYINQTVVSGNLTSLNYTLPNTGTFYWNVTCWDGVGNVNQSATLWFTYIAHPTIENFTLNATTVMNYSWDNLTCNYNLNLSTTSAAVSWYKNYQSTMTLNLPFEGNSTNALLDWSGNGRNATLNNSISVQPIWNKSIGRKGTGAFDFSQKVGDRLILNNSQLKDIHNSGEITYEIWYYYISGSTTLYHRGSINSLCGDDMQSEPEISTDTVELSGTTFASFSSKNNQWNHLVITFSISKDNASVYLNGDLNVSDTITNIKLSGNSGRIFNSTTNISYIGVKHINCDNFAEGFDGFLDEFRIYNYALSAQQILALYNNRTDLIVSQETEEGEVWQCRVTPFTYHEAGQTYYSNSLTIRDTIAPRISLSIPMDSFNTSNTSVYFNFTASDNIAINFTCNLTINDVVNKSINVTRINVTTNAVANITVTNFTDNLYYWNISCMDNWGNTNSSATRWFKVDTTPPEITIDEPDLGEVVGWVVQIRNTISDGIGVGVNRAWLQIINSTENIILVSDLNESLSWDMDWSSYINITNGTDNFPINMTVFANDTLGNKQNATVYFAVDNKAPSVQFIYPDNDSLFFSSGFNMSVYVSDMHLNASLYNITNSTGALIQNNSNFSITTNVTWWNDTLLKSSFPDGNYTINVWAQDMAHTFTLKTLLFYFDSLVPVITFNTPPTPQNNSYINNQTFQINITCIEVFKQNMSFRVDSIKYTFESTDYDNYYNFTPVLSEGIHYYNATCLDKANNRNTTETRKITVDLTPPSVIYSQDNPNSGIVVRQNYVYTNITFTELYFNNITFYLYNSTGDLYTNVTLNLPQNTSYNFSVSVPDYDGLMYYNVTVYDKAGNKNSTSTYNITLDNTPPAIEIIKPINNEAYASENVTLNASITEIHPDSMWYEVDQNGSLYPACSNGCTSFELVHYYFTSGWHNFTVYANDTLNNINSSFISFLIDTIPPSITLTFPKNASVVLTNNITFNFTIGENVYENITCNMTLNSNLIKENMNLTMNISVGNYTEVNYTISSYGLYYWDVSCYDGRYNVNTTDTYVFEYAEQPIIENVKINITASSYENISRDNLTCSVSGIQSIYNTTLVYNFYEDGNSYYLLNMPFDTDNIEIQATGIVRDYSDKGNNATNNGAIWSNSSGINTSGITSEVTSGAYTFNGVDSYINISSNELIDVVENFSISLFFKSAESTADMDNIEGLISKEFSYQIYLSNIDDSVVFRFDSTMTNCLANVPIDADTWYHVAATYDGTNMRIYLDGVLENICPSARPSKNSDNLIIGAISEYSSYFEGTIDNVMMFNNTLSQEQIQLFNKTQFNMVHRSMVEGYKNWSCSVYASNSHFESYQTFSENLYIGEYIEPIVLSISVNDESTYDEEATLNSGTTKQMNCSGQFGIYGQTNTFFVNSSLYHNDYSTFQSNDNESVHYTNNSCTIVNNGLLYYNFTCSYNVFYFAKPGNWTCMMNLTDKFDEIGFGNDSVEMMDLISLNITQDEISFNVVNKDNNTGLDDFNATVYNLGNVDLDMIMYPYAFDMFDNLSMNCTTGNLTDSALSYSLVPNTDYFSKIQLNSTGTVVDMNLSTTTNSSLLSYNNAYLGIGTQDNSGKGFCKGHILMSALKSE